jgi:putative transposase
MLVAEKFNRSFVENYGNILYTQMRYMVSRSMYRNWIKTFIYSPLEKSFMEKINRYFKDRTESFDDYYHCIHWCWLFMIFDGSSNCIGC